MDIVGDRKYVEIPGDKLHELPPLLVHDKPEVPRLDKVFGAAADIIESDDMLSALPLEATPPLEFDRRRTDLALNLVDQYMELVRHWQWGDAVLEWIRQCEITFTGRLELRHLLCCDVWPHAGRCSFVSLLADKAVVAPHQLEKGVGLRLAFRQPPPIQCCSNQFLLYLNGTVATSAYDTWSHLTPGPVSYLPPERFKFDVVTM